MPGSASDLMILKIVSVFLIYIATLAVFGRLRMPKIPGLVRKRAKCKSCGRPLIGKGPCDCGKGA